EIAARHDQLAGLDLGDLEADLQGPERLAAIAEQRDRERVAGGREDGRGQRGRGEQCEDREAPTEHASSIRWIAPRDNFSARLWSGRRSAENLLARGSALRQAPAVVIERRSGPTIVGARLATAAIVTLAAIAAWRWWWAPRQAAAIEREELVELRRAAIETLREFEIDTELADRQLDADALSWRAPGECVEVYRLRIDEHHRDASVATFIGREEQHATHHLALAEDRSRGRGREDPTPVIGVLLVEAEPPRVRE